MTRIAAVRGALPPNRHSQAEITDAFARLCLPPGTDRRLLDRLHASARVRTRNLALPLADYAKLDGFGAANDAFIATALDLGTQAVSAALEEAGLGPRDVDLIMFTSVTGVAAPSIDARIAGRLGFRPDVRRLPIFGLGCVAGAAGIARLHDHLLGRPGHAAVLLSVELCSLTLQREDVSTANLVGSALFGDGATAVVALGAERGQAAPGPVVVDTRSRLYPGTERTMGWDVGDDGFRIVLDAGIPDLVRTHLAADVRAFLADHGLTTRDVTAWVCHPGGPKVLEAVTEALDLPADALELTWRSLAEIGNLSSSSVLYVLRDTLALRPPPPGTPGLLLAMGPGFCSELVLLRW
ncbi:type III polyketide synthase [Rhizohabitans arisaemae]|uniref:type III polyketide synthase n=1 Tax=Rhizohabitans arisaemae TaxID=2720610 RepID=UPI0024B1D1BD|nr:3-oxoacyl-[acyl-carrier-protein] synthase III C-terminal domain-containing protein [Rhizohabitans arisaemae]